MPIRPDHYSGTDEDYAKANKQCADLKSAVNWAPLRSKMPLAIKQIPTRQMLEVNEVPTDEEMRLIGTYEGVLRGCREAYRAAGFPSSASEDIIEARVSKLRYGLFKGEIPYAVYNYGVAKILQRNAGFEATKAEAYAKGEEIGRQRWAQFNAQMQQQMRHQQMMSEINSLNNRLDTYYNSSSYGGTWNCTASNIHSYGGSVSFNYSCF